MLNGLDEAVLIMVIGYRLSATGFFSLPELRAENGDKAGAGNQGFLDQIEGLKWAKRNAKFFGTLDNPRITVFGESAGAYDISLHLSTSMSIGLFDGAIMQSPYSALTWIDCNTTETYSEVVAEQLCKGLPDRLSCLRGKPGKDVIKAMKDAMKKAPVSSSTDFYPCKDGYLFKCPPLETMLDKTGTKCGKTPIVPVIVGMNQEEGHLMVPEIGRDNWNLTDNHSFNVTIVKLYNDIASRFGAFTASELGIERDVINRAYALYPEEEVAMWLWGASTSANRALSLDIMRLGKMLGDDYTFGSTVYHGARGWASKGMDVYVYRFNVTADQLFLQLSGPTHAFDVPYVFGTFKEFVGACVCACICLRVCERAQPCRRVRVCMCACLRTSTPAPPLVRVCMSMPVSLSVCAGVCLSACLCTCKRQC